MPNGSAQHIALSVYCHLVTSSHCLVVLDDIYTVHLWREAGFMNMVLIGNMVMRRETLTDIIIARALPPMVQVIPNE